MEIQQKEKESLAAYIHQFKREANRCKFNNDAATIRIFIKGSGIHTLWQQGFMRRDPKAWQMPLKKLKSSKQHSN